MKQFLLGVAIVTGMSVSAMKPATPGPKPKKHHCTSACTKEKHVYAHGEKGHVCTEACKKAKV